MVQIFDSWAANLSPMDFDVFAGPYLHYIIKEAKKVLQGVALWHGCGMGMACVVWAAVELPALGRQGGAGQVLVCVHFSSAHTHRRHPPP